jgi:hypothetical protein
MVPDLPMFVPGPLEYSTTHSWLGVVTIDVPIGRLGVVIWAELLPDPIVDICPGAAPPARTPTAGSRWCRIRPFGPRSRPPRPSARSCA